MAKKLTDSGAGCRVVIMSKRARH